MPDNDANQKALLIAASFIAAVRTAHEEKIVSTSWPVKDAVGDSVRIAEMVWKRIEREE